MADRVPMRVTRNKKKKYGKHREGAVPFTFWIDDEFKEKIRATAASVDLPKWSMSDHMDYIVKEHFGMWDKPWRPNPTKPTCEAPSRKTAHR